VGTVKSLWANAAVKNGHFSHKRQLSVKILRLSSRWTPYIWEADFAHPDIWWLSCRVNNSRVQKN
jgi:hypothetical protein